MRKICQASKILDETVDSFLESSDSVDALNMWARGYYSSTELVDRLRVELDRCRRRAEENEADRGAEPAEQDAEDAAEMYGTALGVG